MNWIFTEVDRGWQGMVVTPLILLAILIATAIKRWLPKRGRRIIYIASIQHQLQKSGVFEAGSMSRINKVLDLVNSDDALKLVELTSIPDRVWDNNVLEQIVNENTCDPAADVCQQIDHFTHICNRILDVSPQWLLYSDKDSMLAELIQVFTSQPVHMAGAK